MDLVIRSKKRLYEGKQRANLIRRIDEAPETHTCFPNICFPENEPAMISSKKLIGPPLTTHIFLCNKGVYHICTEDECRLYRNERSGACPVSGICHRSSETAYYDKNDPRTWRSNLQRRGNELPREPLKKKKTHQLPLKDKEVISQAESIVHKLLFSNIRTAINKRFRECCLREYEDARKVYLAKRKAEGQFPISSDLIEMCAFYVNKPMPVVEFQVNDSLKRRLALVILQMYKRVSRRIRERPSLQHVAVSTLYLMRTGCIIDGTVLLPQDLFLAEHLPPMNTLSAYNIDRRSIKKGEAMVKAALTEDIEHGEDVEIDRYDTKTEHAVHDVVYFKSVNRKA